jgi:uncharacterized alpha-E superfamily protein
MLGRTANSVYWMARYVERAENLSRLLASTYHMSLISPASGNGTGEWLAALGIHRDQAAFRQRYEDVSAGNVIAFLGLEPDNGNSIRANIRMARENARATRPELTTEVWEAINQTHLELEALSYPKILDKGFQEFFDWVKERSHLFRGAIAGTMRRGEAFTFCQLGTFIERADNTARFLGLKWALLMPSVGKQMSAEDYYRWGALLRSFSAFKAYREVYSVIIEPRRVAELLVLRPDMPRSLFNCVGEELVILRNLRRNAACTRHAERIHARMEVGRIDSILRSGLSRYLDDFVRQNNELHEMIGQEFMLVQ